MVLRFKLLLILFLLLFTINAFAASGGGWHAILQNADDVVKTQPQNGQILSYNLIKQQWQLATPSSWFTAQYPADAAGFLYDDGTGNLSWTAPSVPTLDSVLTAGNTSALTATFGQLIDSGLTASKVVFTDASKQLTSTGIGTSSQFLKADGSVDSSAYLTALTGAWLDATAQTGLTGDKTGSFNLTTTGTLGAGATTLSGDLTFTDGVDRNIQLQSQSVPNTKGNDLSIMAGGGNGVVAHGGDLYLYSGLGGGAGLGTYGKIIIGNVGEFYDAIIDNSLLITTDRTFTFPDNSGTFLTDNMDVNLGTHSLTTTGTGTFGSQSSLYGNSIVLGETQNTYWGQPLPSVKGFTSSFGASMLQFTDLLYVQSSGSNVFGGDNAQVLFTDGLSASGSAGIVVDFDGALTGNIGLHLQSFLGIHYTVYVDGADLNVAGTGTFSGITTGNGFFVKEGTNATMGIATLVAGVAVVSTTKVTANSRIFLTRQTTAGTLGTSVDVTARTAGTSFTITSNGSILDTSTVAWMIVEPA